MANCLPPSFESNSYRGGNIVIDLSGNNQNYSELISAYDSAKPAIYLGDGWCTFPDLDNFDSEKLLKAFTLKEKDSCDSIWDPSLTYTDSCQRTSLSISALRQLEALFNLSQLLFGLSRAETVNYTFRDLQLRKHPHSFKKSGFKQLNFDGRTDFYAVFEQLVNVIIEEGGLEVTLLMYKNPMLPMVRQKCLDLISNVATVPDVAFKIMRHQSWFLDHLLILVRDGEIVSDKIPALSVLIRLLKVMLTERMISAYMKLVDMQYIDCLVDIFENSQYTDSAEFLPFFIKFEFITMQSLTVILGDSEYSQLWSDKAKTRLLNYCMVVFLKAAGAYPTNPSSDRMEQINHIFYAEQHTNKHSLAHTIMTVTELLRNDENMKMFYRYHRSFKQLIIQLYKKYGAKSQYIRTDPGISYALNHLMRVLYIKNAHPAGNAFASSTVSSIQQQSVKSPRHSSKNLLHDIDDRKEPKICSNPECKNEETKYKKFKMCPNCDGQAAYCSSKCKKAHIGTHMINECRRDELIYNCKSKDPEQTDDVVYENVKATKRQSSYNRIYSSTSTSNYQKNGASRRASENLHQKNYQEHFQKLNDIQQRRRESSGGRECNYQDISKQKKLSKFSSMNDNQRRSSLTNEECTTDNFKTSKVQVRTVYAKHTSSMKESKSAALRRMSALDEEENNKLKLLNSRDNHQSKPIVINDTTISSFQFHRPLKTSTALCLPDLTRRQSLKDERIIENVHEDQALFKQENGLIEQQLVNQLKIGNNTLEPNQKISDSSSSYASNISSSESTSISSTISNNQQKKIKTPSGNKAIPKIEKLKKQKESQRKKEQQYEELNPLTKRRHSGTSSMSSPSTSTMQTTTTTFTSASTDKPEPQFTGNGKSSFNSIEEVLFYKGGGNSNSGPSSDAIRFIDNMDNTSSDENEDSDIDSEQESEIDEVFSDNSSSKNSTQSSDDHMEETEKRSVKIQKYTNLASEPNNENEEDCENWSNNDDNIQLVQKRLSLGGTNQSKKSQANEEEDEHERRSHFKVVKEFEKTMEFVKNASNLKVMPSLATHDSVNQQQQLQQPNKQEEDTKKHDNFEKPSNFEGQQISLASLYYDYDEMDNHKISNQLGSNKNQLKLLSSDDEENDSDSDSNSSKEPAFTRENRPSLKGRNLIKGVNLIINNSIDSHMLTSNYKTAPAATQNSTPLNRKNTDINLKKNYQKNYRRHSNGVSTPYLGASNKQLVGDRKAIDDSDGYRGGERIQGTNCMSQGDEFIDDEMSLFKNKNDTLTTNRPGDYKAFKGPLIEPIKENFHGVASTPNLQFAHNQNNRRSVLVNNELILHKEKEMRNRNSQPVPQQQQQQQQAYVQKHTELKVFNNINSNTTINSLNQTEQSSAGPVKAELPKNSTPISTDHGTQQHLSAKHRHFLNAQLDLTIVAAKQQTALVQRKTNSPNTQNPVFLVPQVPAPHKEQNQVVSSAPAPPEIKKSSLSNVVNMGSYKTSTLKSNSNLVVSSDVHKKKLGNHLLTADILDVSKISALENATSTNACVVVTKADIPKDLRRSLKDEFKKDKKQCSIS